MKPIVTLEDLPRRRFLGLSLGVVAAGLASLPTRWAFAQSDEVLTLDEAIAKSVGDKAVEDDAGGLISLDLPQIAENGNTVPLGVSVNSPMTEDDYVQAVHLFADGNPRPEVATFHFTTRSGAASASTRMRLAKTQNVVAVAELSDGRVLRAQSEVKVTIGGCGG